MERLQTGQDRSSTSKVSRLNTVPAGHRYAMVMPSYFSSLSRFNAKKPSPYHHDMQGKTILAFSRIVPIYAALGVPEIWRYDGSQAYFYHLAGEQYVETSHSQAFPFLPSTILAQCIEQSKTEGQDAALDAARAWVRVHKATENE